MAADLHDKPQSSDIRKFETLGTRSFPLEQGIGEAINFHQGIGSKRKEERIRFLKDYWATKVQGIPKVKSQTHRSTPGIPVRSWRQH